jgi:hypothetical protein
VHDDQRHPDCCGCDAALLLTLQKRCAPRVARPLAV